eukprot:TRINITY_DN7276_c0_g1_i8.p1 TRINITY_DN7276_c0_g1~~TRINITY_DN7276_c0_g1_i8.p1  ORF type:complete len:366 (-),score=70.33 TRINITY_DN7276_c0_g1_i8:121-1218(-)
MFGAEQESSICFSVTDEAFKMQASDSSASNLNNLMKEISGELLEETEAKEDIELLKEAEETKEANKEQIPLVFSNKAEAKRENFKRLLEVVQENGSESSHSNSLISAHNARHARRAADLSKVSSASVVSKGHTVDDKDDLSANAMRRNNSFSLARDYKASAPESSKRASSYRNGCVQNELVLKEMHEEIKDEPMQLHEDESKIQDFNKPDNVLINAVKPNSTLPRRTGECSASYTIDQYSKIKSAAKFDKGFNRDLTSQIACESKGTDNLALSTAGGFSNGPLSAYTGLPTSKGTMFQSFSTNKAAFSSGLSGNMKEVAGNLSSINIKRLEESSELKKGSTKSSELLKLTSPKFKVHTQFNVYKP